MDDEILTTFHTNLALVETNDRLWSRSKRFDCVFVASERVTWLISRLCFRIDNCVFLTVLTSDSDEILLGHFFLELSKCFFFFSIFKLASFFSIIFFYSIIFFQESALTVIPECTNIFFLKWSSANKSISTHKWESRFVAYSLMTFKGQ